MAGKAFAVIHDEYGDRLLGQWWTAGGYLAGCHVKEIGGYSVVLTERQSGREITLTLAGTGGSEAEDPAQRRKDWINSDENPMYFRPFPLPAEVSGAWPNLAEEDKAHVAAVYRDFGWALVVTESAAGGPHCDWKNIYADDRSAATAQAKVDFENSLNPAQRAIFARIKATRAEPHSGTISREQDEADNQVRMKEWPRLQASLSPSQLEIYQAIIDPFKAMKRRNEALKAAH